MNSPTEGENGDERDGGEDPPQPTRRRRNTHDRSNWVIALMTFLMTFFIFVQVAAYLITERSVLTINSVIWSTKIPLPAKDTLIDFGLRNSGGIPATITTLAIAVSDKLGDKALSVGDYGVQIPSGQTNRNVVGIKNTPFRFTEKEVDELSRGQAKRYIYGFVEYRDDFHFVFGKSVVGFCYVSDPEPNNKGNFSNCIVLNPNLPSLNASGHRLRISS